MRSKYDTVTATFNDAPIRDELLVIWAFATRGRLQARFGGLQVGEIQGNARQDTRARDCLFPRPARALCRLILHRAGAIVFFTNVLVSAISAHVRRYFCRQKWGVKVPSSQRYFMMRSETTQTNKKPFRHTGYEVL